MLELWNEAYSIYVDGDYGQMRNYLREQVKAGNLTEGDADTIAEDVVSTADL